VTTPRSRDAVSIVARQLELTARGVRAALWPMLRQREADPTNPDLQRLRDSRRELVEMLDALGRMLDSRPDGQPCLNPQWLRISPDQTEQVVVTQEQMDAQIGGPRLGPWNYYAYEPFWI
jgi:hypothetical protein